MIDIIIYFSGQTEKIKLLYINLSNIYKDNFQLHIIENHIVSNDLKEYLKNNTFYYSDIIIAVSNINNNFIIFQNLCCLYNKNIFCNLKNKIKNFNFIALFKSIENTKLSKDFKLKIYKNKFPDIIIFKKNIFLEKKIKFNSNWNKCENYITYCTKEISFIFPEKIPRIVHLYWSNDKFDYLTSLCIKTLVFHNPDWIINLWLPKIKYNISEDYASKEYCPPHSFIYNDDDYKDLNYLKHVLGINLRYIDYFDLNLKSNMLEIYKSDIFRWKILFEEGGIWSDMDILFTNRIENIDFTQQNCLFNEIETVISQYSRKLYPNSLFLEENYINIDFYYIGLMMSSKNNNFFKKLYDLCINSVKINSEYQQFGGDLIMKTFGKFENILNSISNIKYCNLQSDSIYHYWWGDLKKMFIINNNIDEIEYVIQNNNITGYHWFRGVYLSKIYTIFENYKEKIHNYDLFKGPIPKLSEYYKNIFNDFTLKNEQKKISIIMGYINRLIQLKFTLKTILNSSHKNLEIIIINDGDEDISILKTEFNLLNIIIINNYLNIYQNPCMSYNRGIEQSSGEIILIQNPECCHVGDILTIINSTLKHDEYLAFSAFYLNNFNDNDHLYSIYNTYNNNNKEWSNELMFHLFTLTENEDIIKNSQLDPSTKGWCSHHFNNPNYYHFCSAIYRETLIDTIGGFTPDYKDGICFDDDDFIMKIKLSNLKMKYFQNGYSSLSYPELVEFSAYVFHQHHDRTFSYSNEQNLQLWKTNKEIFLKKTKYYISQKINNNIYIKDYNIEFSIYNKILYNDCNNLFEINFSSSNNNWIEINLLHQKLEYKFNGGKLMLINDFKELYKKMEYYIEIYCPFNTTLIINNIVLEKTGFCFIYKGQLKDNKIKIENLNIETKFKVNIIMIENTNYMDNTNLISIN